MLERRTLLSGTPVTLATFNGSITPSLAVDSSGNVFGVTPSSNISNGTIFEIPAGTGTVRTLASFNGLGSSTSPGSNPTSIVVDSSGNLFGTATANTTTESLNYSGTLPDTEIWELAAGASVIQKYATIGPSAVLDSINANGDLFGTGNTSADFFNNEAVHYYVFEYAKSSGFTVISQGEEGLSAEVGPPPSPYPIAMTADSTGNAFVAFDSNGSNSLASGSIEQFSASNYSAGTTVLANLENLTDEQVAGMTTDQAGNLYAAFNGYYQSTPSGRVASGEIVELKAGSHQSVSLINLDNQPNDTFSGALLSDADGDLFTTVNNSVSGSSSVVEWKPGAAALRTILLDAGSTLAINFQGNLYAAGSASISELPGAGTAVSTPSLVPTTGVEPTITSVALPASILTTQRLQGAVRISLHPLASGTSSGFITTQLYASNGDYDQILLGKAVQHYKGGNSPFTATIHISIKMPVGAYEPVTTTTDAAGDLLSSAPASALIVSAPFSNISATLISITPTVDRGGTGSLVLQFQNTGNATASRSVSLTIVATPLGGVEPSDTLFTGQLKLRIPDNRAGVRMRLKFKLSIQAQGLQDLMTVTVQGTATISTSNSILLEIGPEIAG